MHGFTKDADGTDTQQSSRLIGFVAQWCRTHPGFLAIVMAPTLLAALYFYVFVADQYVSEAHFVVRSVEDNQMPTGGLGQVLSLASGMSGSRTDALSVGDYLSSHDAVNALRISGNLVERFRRPEADALSRLSTDQPTAEKLLSFYRRHVDVNFDADTGITTLRVRAFRRGDAYTLVKMLLTLGERRVNALNHRVFNDGIAASQRELDLAERYLTQTQIAMTQFRQGNRDIDPTSTGQAQTKLVSGLEEALAQSKAQLSAMSGIISHNSPQYVALAANVAALENQVGSQAGRLTGNGERTIAAKLGRYEELRLRQQFAAKRYEAAAATFEKAREQAQKQQLFIVRIVEPNVPEKATYPQSTKIIGTIFASLLLIYAIGWLIVAGVREHAS